MVFGALKFHVAASWALLFLAAAMQQAFATTTSTSSACDAEVNACYSEDTECLECMTQDLSEGCHLLSVPDDNDFCTLMSFNACCIAEGSPNDCLGNSAYLEFWECSINDISINNGEGECNIDWTCNFGSAGDDTGMVDDDTDGATDATGEITGDDTNGTDGVACPSAMLTFVLGLAFVTFSSIQHG